MLRQLGAGLSVHPWRRGRFAAKQVRQEQKHKQEPFAFAGFGTRMGLSNAGNTEKQLRDTVLATFNTEADISAGLVISVLTGQPDVLHQEASWPKLLVDVVFLTRAPDEDPGRGRAIRRLYCSK